VYVHVHSICSHYNENVLRIKSDNSLRSISMFMLNFQVYNFCKTKRYKKNEHGECNIASWKIVIFCKNDVALVSICKISDPVVSRPLQPKFVEIGPVYSGSRLYWQQALQKPYTKSESGTNLVMYDVYWLVMMISFMGSKYLNTFPVSR
jgi:hypothetical protein